MINNCEWNISFYQLASKLNISELLDGKKSSVKSIIDSRQCALSLISALICYMQCEWSSAQSDQHLCYSHFGKYHIYVFYKQNFSILASLGC